MPPNRSIKIMGGGLKKGSPKRQENPIDLNIVGSSTRKWKDGTRNRLRGLHPHLLQAKKKRILRNNLRSQAQDAITKHMNASKKKNMYMVLRMHGNKYHVLYVCL